MSCAFARRIRPRAGEVKTGPYNGLHMVGLGSNQIQMKRAAYLSTTKSVLDRHAVDPPQWLREDAFYTKLASLKAIEVAAAPAPASVTPSMPAFTPRHLSFRVFVCFRSRRFFSWFCFRARM